MLEVMNSDMFNVIKNQFKSNLQQDILALSGFCTDEELLDIIDQCHEVVVKKSNAIPEKD